jgi:hypothetical protein
MQIFVNTLFRRGGKMPRRRPIYGKESGLGFSSVPTSETANGVVGLDLVSIFTKSDLFSTIWPLLSCILFDGRM